MSTSDSSMDDKSEMRADIEPDGYAVLLDDPKGDTPGGCGYWYVGAYRTEALAKNVAERGTQGARVVPMFFAPQPNAAPQEREAARPATIIPPGISAQEPADAALIEECRKALAPQPRPDDKSESAPSLDRNAIIEEVAKRVESAPLTYAGPDPQGVRDLRYLIVALIRDMKGA